MRAFYLLVFKKQSLSFLARETNERIKGAIGLISNSNKGSITLRDPSAPRLRLCAQGDIWVLIYIFNKHCKKLHYLLLLLFFKNEACHPEQESEANAPKDLLA